MNRVLDLIVIFFLFIIILGSKFDMNSLNKSNFSFIEIEENPLFNIPNETGSPERRLLLAMLERAILDYVGNDQKEMAEAEEWLFGDDENGVISDTIRTFSFNWICQELDLNPLHIQSKIKSMPKRGDRRIPPWYFMKHAPSNN